MLVYKIKIDVLVRRTSYDKPYGIGIINVLALNTFQCKKCGYEYQSKVLQTPDEETLVSEPHEDIVENCQKCNQISSP